MSWTPEKSRAYYLNSREVRLEYQKQDAKDHKDERNANFLKWKQEHPDAAKAIQKKYYDMPQTKEKRLRKKYNLTDAQYQHYLDATNCEICNKEFANGKDKHLDHCHDTGEFRGVLCRACNHGIGNFKDNILLMLKGINYLETKTFGVI